MSQSTLSQSSSSLKALNTSSKALNTSSKALNTSSKALNSSASKLPTRPGSGGTTSTRPGSGDNKSTSQTEISQPSPNASSKFRAGVNTLKATIGLQSASKISKNAALGKTKQLTPEMIQLTKSIEGGLDLFFKDNELVVPNYSRWEKELIGNGIGFLMNNIQNFYHHFIKNLDKQPINSEILLESIQVFFVDITSALIKFINSDGEPIKDIVWSAEKIEAVIKECIPFPNFEEGQNDEGHVAVLKARIYSLITFHRVFSILLNQIQEKDNKMEELFTSFKKLEEENALLKDILSASQTEFDFKKILSLISNQIKTQKTAFKKELETAQKHAASSMKDQSVIAPDISSETDLFIRNYFLKLANEPYVPVPKFETRNIHTNTEALFSMPTARKTTSDQKEDMFVQIAHSSTQVDPIRHSSSGAQVPEDVGFKSPEIVLEDMINEVESWKTEAHNWREKFHARKRSSMAISKMAALEDVESELNTQIHEHSNQIFELKKQIGAAQDQKNSIQTEIDNLKAELKTKKSSLVEANSKCTTLEITASTMKRNIKNLQSQKATFESKVSNAQKICDTQSAQITALETEKRQYITTLATIKTDLQNAIEAGNNYNVEIAKLKADSKRLENDIALLVTFQEDKDQIRNEKLDEDKIIVGTLEANRIRIERLENKNLELIARRMELGTAYK